MSKSKYFIQSLVCISAFMIVLWGTVSLQAQVGGGAGVGGSARPGDGYVGISQAVHVAGGDLSIDIYELKGGAQTDELARVTGSFTNSDYELKMGDYNERAGPSGAEGAIFWLQTGGGDVFIGVRHQTNRVGIDLQSQRVQLGEYPFDTGNFIVISKGNDTINIQSTNTYVGGTLNIQHLLPRGHALYSLGSDTQRFVKGWFTSNSTEIGSLSLSDMGGSVFGLNGIPVLSTNTAATGLVWTASGLGLLPTWQVDGGGSMNDWIDDVTPQAGGNVDMNSFDLHFGTSDFKAGASNELFMVFSGSFAGGSAEWNIGDDNVAGRGFRLFWNESFGVAGIGDNAVTRTEWDLSGGRIDGRALTFSWEVLLADTMSWDGLNLDIAEANLMGGDASEEYANLAGSFFSGDGVLQFGDLAPWGSYQWLLEFDEAAATWRLGGTDTYISALESAGDVTLFGTNDFLIDATFALITLGDFSLPTTAGTNGQILVHGAGTTTSWQNP